MNVMLAAIIIIIIHTNNRQQIFRISMSHQYDIFISQHQTHG